MRTGKEDLAREENSFHCRSGNAPDYRGFSAFLIDEEKNHLYCCLLCVGRRFGPGSRRREQRASVAPSDHV